MGQQHVPVIAVQLDRVNPAVDERAPDLHLLGHARRVARGGNEQQLTMQPAGLVGPRHHDVVLDHALQRQQALVRPFIEPEAGPPSDQLQHPGLGRWISRGKGGHVPELREHEVVDHPRLIAQRDRFQIGQRRVQDDERPDPLAAALQFLADRECDVPAQRPAQQVVGTGRLSHPDLVGVVLRHLLHAGRQRLGSPQAAGLQTVERVLGIDVRQQAHIAPAQAHHRMGAEQGRAVGDPHRHERVEDAPRCPGRRAMEPQGLKVLDRKQPAARPARRRLPRLDSRGLLRPGRCRLGRCRLGRRCVRAALLRIRQRHERQSRAAQPLDQRSGDVDDLQIQVGLGQPGRDELRRRREVVQERDAAAALDQGLRDRVHAAIGRLPVPVGDVPVPALCMPSDRPGKAGDWPVAHAVRRPEPHGLAWVAADSLRAPAQLVGGVLRRAEGTMPVAVQPDHVPAVPVDAEYVAMPLDALAEHEKCPRHALVAQ